MTRQDFNTVIETKYQMHKNAWLELSKDGIYECAYTIAKLQAIRDYLIGTIDDEVEPIYDIADMALDIIVNEELKYDTPMWTTWDDLLVVIEDYLERR